MFLGLNGEEEGGTTISLVKDNIWNAAPDAWRSRSALDADSRFDDLSCMKAMEVIVEHYTRK